MDKINKDPFFRMLAKTAAERSLPSTVIWELTYGCNFKCVHCFNPTHRALPEELSLAEADRMIEDLRNFGMFYINFTGGELFTRPDVLTILKKAKSQGFLIGINSNASRLVPDLIKELEKFDILSMGVSIYGATEGTYEKMTETPGSFKHFMAGLQALSKTAIPVEIRMPVTTLNNKEIKSAREMAESFGFGFSYSLDIEPRQTGDTTPLGIRLSPEEKMAILKEIDPQELTEEDEMPVTDYLDCTCGRGEQFAITPYGEMNFCTSFPYPKYNLRKGNVREGWEFLKSARKKIGPNENYECPSCEFRPFCRQGRNDAWLETGDASRCLPHFKDWAKLEKEHCLSQWKK